MRYVAAYMLATLGGKASPNADDVKRILSSVGVESDQNKIDIVLKNLQGKNIDELIAEGLTKLSTMPSGGGGAAATSEVAADSAAKPDDKKKGTF